MLENLLANQGVSSIKVKVSMGWQELKQSRLKILCSEQEEEDMRMFRNKAMEASS